MKKIKTIDLLNKISRGDEIPNEIIFNEKKYKLDSFTNWYRHTDVLGNYDDLFIDKNRLNDYVEIVEKEKEINIQEIKEFKDKKITTEERVKINELIKAIKQLDRKISKGE